MGDTQITDAKKRYSAGVLKYRQMGYWMPDYVQAANNGGNITIGGSTGTWRLGDIVSSTPRLQSSVKLNAYNIAPSAVPFREDMAVEKALLGGLTSAEREQLGRLLAKLALHVALPFGPAGRPSATT